MDINRRRFLKVLFIGSGALLVEKVLGPLFSMFLDDSSVKSTSENIPKSRNFRVVEDEKVLSIYDNSGEEIFQIDKSHS